MPLFLSDEEYERCAHDGSLVAEKADAFIGELNNQLRAVKNRADEAASNDEFSYTYLVQKYVSSCSEFLNLESQLSLLNSSLDQCASELAQVQAEKRQIHIQSICKDGEIDRLSIEVYDLRKSEKKLMELVEQKDLEISEKYAIIKGNLDKNRAHGVSASRSCTSSTCPFSKMKD